MDASETAQRESLPSHRRWQFSLRGLFLSVALAAVVSFLGYLLIETKRMILRVEQENIFYNIQEGKMTRQQAPAWFTDEDYERLDREAK